jgi:hypothetical protein
MHRIYQGEKTWKTSSNFSLQRGLDHYSGVRIGFLTPLNILA